MILAKRIAAIVLGVTITGGCASIITGTTQEVVFQSNPEGAHVIIEGKVIGTTPLAYVLKKKKGQSLVFEKPGYKKLMVQLETRISAWFFGNIFSSYTSTTGSSVDGLSGAMHEYSPSQYMVSLEVIGNGQLGGRVTNPKSQKTKEFIVMGYNNILSDLSKGQGAHLFSLLQSLEIPNRNKSEATRKIRALSEIYTDVPEFAEQVVSLFPLSGSRSFKDEPISDRDLAYMPKLDALGVPIESVRSVPDFNAASRDNDLAIIIGIENYKDLPQSSYSINDARIVKDYIKALGFRERNIEFLTGDRATRSSIVKSVEVWLPNRVKPESRIFFYYSGHGAPKPSTGESYLVPYDGDPNYLEVTGYPLKRLYEKLGKLPAAEVVVLLDSCFSGAGGRSVLAKGARPLVIVQKGIAIRENTAVLSATQGSQISTSSPEKGHGIFTYYFLKALKDGKKDLSEIYSYIKPLIEDEAKSLNVEQSPMLTPMPELIAGKFPLRLQ